MYLLQNNLKANLESIENDDFILSSSSLSYIVNSTSEAESSLTDGDVIFFITVSWWKILNNNLDDFVILQVFDSDATVDYEPPVLDDPDGNVPLSFISQKITRLNSAQPLINTETVNGPNDR